MEEDLIKRIMEGLEPIEHFSFSKALKLLKCGFKVYREGWNGKGMFLLYIDPYNNDQYKVIENSRMVGTLYPYIAMKTAENKLVPWLANQTDLLTDDWNVVPVVKSIEEVKE